MQLCSNTLSTNVPPSTIARQASCSHISFRKSGHPESIVHPGLLSRFSQQLVLTVLQSIDHVQMTAVLLLVATIIIGGQTLEEPVNLFAPGNDALQRLLDSWVDSVPWNVTDGIEHAWVVANEDRLGFVFPVEQSFELVSFGASDRTSAIVEHLRESSLVLFVVKDQILNHPILPFPL
jgi:hypothetical protein